MENQEEVLDALGLFEKKPSKDIPDLLERYLVEVAKTGETVFPWHRIKPLFVTKVDQVMDKFNEDVPYDHLLPYPNVEHAKYEEMKTRILEAIENFRGAPFTVQRICELVTEPRKHYKRSDKFLRGVEKNVLVVSTVDPFGRKVVSEPSRAVMNGLDMNSPSRTKLYESRHAEAQPFVPVPHVNWSENSSAASIWPSPTTALSVNLPTNEQTNDDLKSEDPSPTELSSTTENGQAAVSTILDADLPEASSQKPDSANLPNDCVVSDSAKPFIFGNQSPSIEDSESTENVVTENAESLDVTVESEEEQPVEAESVGGDVGEELPQSSSSEETSRLTEGETETDQPPVPEPSIEQIGDEHTEDSTGVATPDNTHPPTEEQQDTCHEPEASPIDPEPAVTPDPDPKPTAVADEPLTSVSDSTDRDDTPSRTEDISNVCQSDISSSDDTDQSTTSLQQDTNQVDSVSEDNKSQQESVSQSQQESVSQSDATVHQSEVCESVLENTQSKEESEASDIVDSQPNAESEVKEDAESSETISSSESMDVDSQQSDKVEETSSQSDVVTTTGLQEMEEPMEQE